MLTKWSELAQSLYVGATHPDRDLVSNELKRLNHLWDNYLKEGFQPLPWEAFANGYGGTSPTSLEPPQHQFILFHPSAGLELRPMPPSQGRRAEVALLEPVGWVSYNTDRTNYWGASVVLSFPSGAGPGVGVLFHGGSKFKLGYVTRRKDSLGRNQDGIVFSLDLYSWFSDGKKTFKNVLDAIH